MVLPDPDVSSTHPRCFVLSSPEGVEAWARFVAEADPTVDRSSFASQWADWCRCEDPAASRDPDVAKRALDARRAESATGQYGTMVWYPWRGVALAVLEEPEFVAVRTNRNQLKILREEQDSLRDKTVGIVGLSVGRSLACALAMERICGCLHLADADTLELSNMNRISASLFDLGLEKSVLTARTIAEIDPYLEVRLWQRGFHAEDAEAFFDGLDLVVDACDGLEAKARLRIEARGRSLPLLMETNDRGLIDIERYDHEPSPGFLHDRLSQDQLEALAGGGAWTPELLDRFVELGQLSERGQQSLPLVGKSLAGWPQLHSDVALGAGATAIIVRKLLLGEDLEDQRLRFDLSARLKTRASS